ncbi:MAG: autotransporter-associated beta strand repeat protein, partial [Phycisphaerales bacterium]|nr:autotransporter-associated beta strand repeat protein [Phycisphaerales bacterium]
VCSSDLTGPNGVPSLNVGAVGSPNSATSGSLIVSNQGALRTNAGNTTATIGGTGTGTLAVQDAGSSWIHTGLVYVGDTTGSTVGTLNIWNGATVNISSTNNAGTLRIGAAGSLNLSGSNSTLNVDSMDLASNAANVHFTSGTLNLAGAINNVGSTPLSIGGTLGGSGTINGGVTVPSGGRIQPGDGTSTGTFSITGPLNLSGTMQMRLLAVNSYSKIIVDPSAGTPVLTGTIALSLPTTYTPAIGASFDLLDFAGTLGPGYTFDFSAASLGSDKQWDTSSFAATGSVSVSAAPEPGTATLAMLASSPLLIRRRRQRV